MRDFLLYLAGPIAGCTYGECTDWRKYVVSKLPPHIHALSPMRGKEFLSAHPMIQGEHAENPLCRQAGITCRDRSDIMRADAVLFNLLGAKTVSIGTVHRVRLGRRISQADHFGHGKRQCARSHDCARSGRIRC